MQFYDYWPHTLGYLKQHDNIANGDVRKITYMFLFAKSFVLDILTYVEIMYNFSSIC